MSWLGLPLWQVGALFGAVAAPLVALYLLRMHRRRVEVPFVRLWERVLREREPSSLWRRLKRWLSLLLQLLFAALLALAIGDPRFVGAGEKARSVVVAVDCSASMQATDVRPNRLARAKEEAKRVVRSLEAASSAMIVRMDAEPVPVSGWETDGRTLERAIDALSSTDTAADWDGTLALAEDALRGRPRPTVVVVSDGAVPASARAPLPPTDVRFVSVGTAAGNVGITAFSVRRYPANRSSYEVLLEIVSHEPKPTRRTLTIEADGEVVDVAKLELAPGERTRRFYPNLSGAESRLMARLEPHDALALDDTAYALLPPRHKQKVLTVTPGNLFLEGALLLFESAEVDRLTPAAYSADRARGYDVVVFDGFAPETPPPARGLIYIAPPAAGSPFAVRGEAVRPFLTETAQGHPLLRWITLTDVNVARSSVFALRPGDVALASSLHQPILVAGQRGGQRVIALGFDLRRSDLPMRVAFPILLMNALDWFAGDDPQVLGTYRTGRPWRVSAGGATEVTLTAPDGERQTAPAAEDGNATFFGRQAGFYRVQAGPAQSSLAANLADPAESDLAPRALVLGGRAAPPPDLGGSGPRRRLWVLLLGAAAILSLFEWFSYQRRWTV